jgi:hypothetical protein
LEKEIEKSDDSESKLSEILALLVRISMEFEDFTTESNIPKKTLLFEFLYIFMIYNVNFTCNSKEVILVLARMKI